MNSIFQNYGLKSAGTVVCKDLNEAKKWAAGVFETLFRYKKKR